MSEHDKTEVVVVGTGAVGLLGALAFAHAGFKVHLVGPEPQTGDRRTTALMDPALRLLDRVRILSTVEPDSAPLSVMRIVDATSRLIRSPAVTFRASEIGKARFGLNIPNAILLSACVDAIASRPDIAWTRSQVEDWILDDGEASAILAGGSKLRAPLVIAADGNGSPARTAAGITAERRSTQQAALVLNFAHSRDHESTSTEFQTEAGPFTQVPLPGKRSSLVWIDRPEKVDELKAATDEILSDLIERRMQSMLGRVKVESGRQVYPLSTVIPTRLAARRVMLVGEAAHVFPPIGAQGLNLGIRDIEDAVLVASGHRADPGTASALMSYELRRRPDVMARSLAVNTLNRSLLSDLLPAQIGRSAMLGLLGHFAPLRGFFMREGMQPGSGLARMFSGTRPPASWMPASGKPASRKPASRKPASGEQVGR